MNGKNKIAFTELSATRMRSGRPSDDNVRPITSKKHAEFKEL